MLFEFLAFVGGGGVDNDQRSICRGRTRRSHTTGDHLVVEGVPPVPFALAESVQRYTESRGAAADDWHPTGASY